MGRRINARLDDELEAEVSELLRRTRKSITQVVKESLERYCAETLRGSGSFEVLDASGFIGCAEGSRSLSSGYKRALSRSLGKKT